MKLKLVMAAIIAITPKFAYASERGPGLITDLQVDGSNAVFAVAGAMTSKPSCAIWDRLTFNVTTPAGQAMFAYLISAQATGKRVRVNGTGSCNQAPDHETAIGVRDGQ